MRNTTLAIFAILTIGCTAPANVEYGTDANGHADANTATDVLNFEDIGLDCEVEPTYGAIRVSISNSSDNAIQILGWDSPWDHLADAFSVIPDNGGQIVEYRGPQVTRAEITADAYITIPPHETVTTEYPLTARYFLEQAPHLVALNKDTLAGFLSGERFVATHNCQPIEVDQANIPPELAMVLEPHSNCSSERQAEIDDAIDWAMRVARLAERDALREDGSAEMRRWFGTSTPLIALPFSRMQDEDEDVRCGSSNTSICADNLGVVMNYVIDHQLFLCSALFSDYHLLAPYTTYASWAGVLVHELSHLVDGFVSITDVSHSVCAWTDNKCYGMQNALDLAEACPGCAMQNAENYERYALDVFYRHIWLTAIL